MHTLNIGEEESEQFFRIVVGKLKLNGGAVFCGAGISFHSGLPLANEMVSAILQKLGLNEAETIAILNSEFPFEAFMETIQLEKNIDIVLDVFKEGQPNTTHRFIAQLIKHGFITTVVTTNFDLLIEKSLAELGLFEGRDYDKYSSENDFGKVDWNNKRIKLIKIHGCISKKDEVAITLQLVANRAHSTNKNHMIHRIFSKDVHETILVMGYSCSDIFDISPQLQTMVNNHSNVLFIEHLLSSEDFDFTLEDLALKPIKNPFTNFKGGQRVVINTDRFIELLWNALIPHTNYQFIKHPKVSWQNFIDSWFAAAEKVNPGVPHHLAGRLLSRISENEAALRHFEKGIAVALQINDLESYGSELGNLAMSYISLSRYPEAKNLLEQSLRICKAIGNIQGEISQSEALGNVYRILHNYPKAEELLNTALHLSEQHGFQRTIGTCLGDLATTYNDWRQFEKAIECAEKGMVISHALGNKQAECSQLLSLSTAYFNLSNSVLAEQYLNEAYTIAMAIGNTYAQCMILVNFSAVHFQKKDYERTLETSTKALLLSKEIKHVLSIGQSSFYVGRAFVSLGKIIEGIDHLNNALIVLQDFYDQNHPYIHAVKAELNIAEYAKQYAGL